MESTEKSPVETTSEAAEVESSMETEITVTYHNGQPDTSNLDIPTESSVKPEMTSQTLTIDPTDAAGHFLALRAPHVEPSVGPAALGARERWELCSSSRT